VAAPRPCATGDLHQPCSHAGICGSEHRKAHPNILYLSGECSRPYAEARTPDRAYDIMLSKGESLSAGEVARKVGQYPRFQVTVLPLDVDDDGSVRGAVEQVLAEQGQVDVLVNNAGIGTNGPIEELPLDMFRQTMETNFFGALRCIQAVLPGMRAQRSGCIINVTSVAGRIAMAPQGPYTASKFALEAVSEVLAQEVKAFNIRVSIVEPGIIQTPVFNKMRTIPAETRYPQERRIQALFAASLAHPVSPAVVGEQIRQIVESENWQLRYPIGPNAVPFLAWRTGMSDEAWIDFGAMQNDEAWCARIAQDFGLDVRSYLG
jgi:NAD(P)-dependent dehydrogenase (short-subunit alcohol dehydrogenase family)